MKDDNYFATWMGGFFGGVVLTVVGIGIYQVYNAKETPCTCYYRTTDDRFREGYTKSNKPCLSIEGGHVKIGDTVYTNVTQYQNICH